MSGRDRNELELLLEGAKDPESKRLLEFAVVYIAKTEEKQRLQWMLEGRASRFQQLKAWEPEHKWAVLALCFADEPDWRNVLPSDFCAAVALLGDYDLNQLPSKSVTALAKDLARMTDVADSAVLRRAVAEMCHIRIGLQLQDVLDTEKKEMLAEAGHRLSTYCRANSCS